MIASSTLVGAVTVGESDLKCAAKRLGPFLDYEFRFIGGAFFELPAKQFWGERFSLSLSMRVRPIDGTPGIARHVEHEFRSRNVIASGTRGRLRFPGAVSTGLGRYEANWRIDDQAGRSCSGTVRFTAALSRRERSVQVALEPGQIMNTGFYMFRPQHHLERPHLREPRRLKVFISLDVLGRRGRLVRTRLLHVMPHLAALRRLATSPSFNAFSVVAFSFEDQRVVARHDYRDAVDFGALRNVVGDLQPDTVDVNDLMRGSELRFFEEVLSSELLGTEPPEAVVFLGQDVAFGKHLPTSRMDRFRHIGAMVSFLDASRFTWRGVIGNFVRAMGGKEYALRRPSDLALAMAGLEARTLRSRPH